MDLKGKIILVNNPEACSWKSFYELHYDYLLHIISFRVFLFAHVFFHDQHFFTYNNYCSFHTLILSQFQRKTQDKNSFHPHFPWPLHELVFFVQWKLWKSFPPINGLFIIHEPLTIDNDLTFQWSFGWKLLCPVKH